MVSQVPLICWVSDMERNSCTWEGKGKNTRREGLDDSPAKAHTTSKSANTWKSHPAVRTLYPMLSFSPRLCLLILAGENQAVDQGRVHYSNQGSGEKLRGDQVSLRAFNGQGFSTVSSAEQVYHMSFVVASYDASPFRWPKLLWPSHQVIWQTADPSLVPSGLGCQSSSHFFDPWWLDRAWTPPGCFEELC